MRAEAWVPYSLPCLSTSPSAWHPNRDENEHLENESTFTHRHYLHTIVSSKWLALIKWPLAVLWFLICNLFIFLCSFPSVSWHLYLPPPQLVTAFPTLLCSDFLTPQMKASVLFSFHLLHRVHYHSPILPTSQHVLLFTRRHAISWTSQPSFSLEHKH